MSIGFTLPFAKSSTKIGYFVTTNDIVSATKQNIRSLLLTNYGERPMHYDLGCNLREFFFENIVEDLRERIIDRISSKVNQWLPYVVIQNIKVSLRKDENRMDIKLEFKVLEKPETLASVELTVTA